MNTFCTESSSEANLRSFSWDNLIAQLLLFGRREGFPVNFMLYSEFKGFLYENREPRMDLSAVSDSYTLPFLIVEIGKKRPSPLQDHKYFSKLLSLCSQSCFELCHEARQNGKDPELVKVFGIWIGATQFRFCVAHPVFTVNRLQKRTEIAVHLSFAPEWRFDLLEVPQPTSCACECCTGTRLKAMILLGSSEFMVPRVNANENDVILQNLEFVDDDTAVNVPNAALINRRSTPASRSIDFVAISKLKVFLECALRTCDEMEDNPDDADPFEFDFPPIPAVTAPSSKPANTLFTPQKEMIAPHSIAVSEVRQPNYHANADVFQITKQRTHESLIYLNSGLCQPFLPLLISLKQCEDDPEKETFVFERMSLLWHSYIYSPFIRTDYFTIDALTLAVHTLYELLLLHEQLGYVHSDISPNNIMFSSIGRIWKITDFNHSLPIQESLITSRTGGTEGYIAPEVIKTGIFTPSSDVYSLGRVLIKHFCLRESHKLCSQEDHEFRNICLGMTEEDPNRRLSVRQALKCSYDLLIGMRIPVEFEVYGKHLILPLVAREFLFEPASFKETVQEIESLLAPNVSMPNASTHQGHKI